MKQDVHKNNEMLTVSRENGKRRIRQIRCLTTLFSSAMTNSELGMKKGIKRYE